MVKRSAVHAGTYGAGVIGAAVAAAAIVCAAVSLRQRLVPSWGGATSRLAESIIGVAVVTTVAQVLGLFGAFRQGWMLLATVATALALTYVARRGRRNFPEVEREKPVRSRREEVVVATMASALVGAQWVSHVAATYGRGITQGDSLWYHATFAARFVESGRVTGLHDTPLSHLAVPLVGYYPLNGSLLQAVAMLPFHNDVLSPLLNFGWAALALVAAVALGRRHGTSALLVLGTVVLLGVPTITGTQPGQAANDIATAALLFASVVLLLEGRFMPAPTALSGIAAGLALGTKMTVVASVAVLAIGVLVVAVRRRAINSGILWFAMLVVFGGFWFARNIAVYHNPAPWMAVDIGPLKLARQTHVNPAIVSQLGRWSGWRDVLYPSLATSLGRGWFVILALAVAGAVLACVRGRNAIERSCGIAVVAGIVFVVFVPEGGDLSGAMFVFFVRYLAPALAIGFALFIMHTAQGPLWLRRMTLVVLAALVVVGATGQYPSELPMWPRYEVIAIAAGAAVVIGVVAWWLVIAPRVHASRFAYATVAVISVAGVVAAGWFVQRHYFARRYVHAGLPHDEANAMFARISGKRVLLLGTEHFYPIFGNDLSNNVAREAPQVSDCGHWRDLIDARRYDYVVIAHDALSAGGLDESWLSSDAGAQPVLHGANESVYRIVRPLDVGRCAADARPLRSSEPSARPWFGGTS